MSARHVVLLTYGEPPTPAFGAQLRYSWRILLGLTRSVAAIPAPLLPMIALARARRRRDQWTKERYGSPLEAITLEQARALAAALSQIAPQAAWRVHPAYEFRDPLLPTLLDRLPAHEPVDVVPMYAADSAFTHEIGRATLAGWSARRPRRAAPVRLLPPLEPDALAALAVAHLRRELAARGIAGGRDWALVLAAHGTLLEPPRPMETGREATERIAIGIARRLDRDFAMIVNGWLNHVYGGRWTEPAAEEALRQVEAAGLRRVVYYPYGFLADNAESELEGRVILREARGIEAVHLPCLNAAPELIDALARQLVDAAGLAEAMPAVAALNERIADG